MRLTAFEDEQFPYPRVAGELRLGQLESCRNRIIQIVPDGVEGRPCRLQPGFIDNPPDPELRVRKYPLDESIG